MFNRVAIFFGLLIFGLFGTDTRAEVPSERLASENFNARGLFNGPQTDSAIGWKGPWKTSRILPAKSIGDGDSRSVLIQGTRARNNPLRRELSQTFSDDDLYVGFRFLYEPKQTKNGQDPEFFVLWLDRTDGSDQAVHNSQVPNIGVHIASKGPSRGKNVFMVRFGARESAWSRTELVPGKSYRLITRLHKETPGPRSDYSQLQLWIDPEPDEADQPVLSLNRQQGIHQIRWVGFATGLKTEPNDRIQIDDLVLSRTWQDAYSYLGTPTDAALEVARSGSQPKVPAGPPIDFAADIYPILNDRCFSCHSGEFPDSGYRLDLRDEMLGYSTGQPFVVPGNSEQSHLVEVLTTKSETSRMPPEEKPLSEDQIAKIRAWIDQGMPWDDKLLPPQKLESSHWAFQKIERPDVPQLEMSDKDHPIDAFVHESQRKRGVEPVGMANRGILVRRLYLDMLGLPPTLEESEAFLSDASDEAWAKLVDRVLESPHYGERMARYWLDLVRWGESQGYQHDIPRPFAWRYRDYVINAFNRDKPHRDFLREQIAGDELKPVTDESLIATGFLASARVSGNEMDKQVQRTGLMFDIVDNTASALLGLTMECAQCHNHKFEPLSQRDYFSFLAFFAKGQTGNLKLSESKDYPADEIKNWFSKGSYDFYIKEAKKLRVDPASYPTHTWGFYSPVTGDPDVEFLPVVNRSPLPYSPETLANGSTHILIRGDVKNPGLLVEPAWPAVLGVTPSTLSPTPRQALANWLGSSDNPLVARVWVNRIWQIHFGRGIVRTPSNFGTHGGTPSHPELLDWLASELIANDWSTKHIHRLIMTSDVYRRAGESSRENLDRDPENVLLWRWPYRRLEAEAIRDSLLVATGELNRTVGGPGVSPERNEKERRRTLYLSQRRSEMPDVMSMFDAPDGVKSCSRREVSTVALQPLYLLNSPFVVKRAERLAERATEQHADDPAEKIAYVFRHALGREPSDIESKSALSLLELPASESSTSQTDAPYLPLVRFCHAMLNLNEFVYLP